VAEATREGARQAVQDVLLELLGNPEVRGLIAGLGPPPPAEPAAPRPTVWTRARARLLAAKTAVVSRCRAATAAVAGTARTLAWVPLKKILLVGVGVAAGVVSHLCPHGLSAVVSGVGGACAAVAAQVGRWARRSAAAFGLVGTS
ncbi:MAG: hypothetical protein JWO38_6655, partial [Gemmataceae bacterium]|nr:hypothetical protein [Gemmataceae bacterium]